jgi:hypothetical protein
MVLDVGIARAFNIQNLSQDGEGKSRLNSCLCGSYDYFGKDFFKPRFSESLINVKKLLREIEKQSTHKKIGLGSRFFTQPMHVSHTWRPRNELFDQKQIEVLHKINAVLRYAPDSIEEEKSLDQTFLELIRAQLGSDRQPFERSKNLARILMGGGTRVCKELIPLIKQEMGWSLASEKQEERYLALLLSRLKDDPSIEDTLFDFPEGNLSALGERLLCSYLIKPLEEKPSKNEIKEYLLSSYLYHKSQTYSANCFASSVARKLILSDCKKVIRDWQALLFRGVVGRNVDGIEHQFPYFITIPHETLSQRYQGPSQIECLKAIIGEGVFNGLEEYRTVKEAVHFLSQSSGQDEEYLQEILEGQSQNLLISQWEQCLADMGQSPSESYFKKMVISSIRNSIQGLVRIISLSLGISKVEFEKRVEEVIKRNQRWVFSPNINQTGGFQGGFVFYGKTNSTKWQKIEEASTFMQFIQQAILMVIDRYPGSELHKRALKAYAVRSLQAEEVYPQIQDDYQTFFVSEGDSLWFPKEGYFVEDVLSVYQEGTLATPPQYFKASTGLSLLNFFYANRDGVKVAVARGIHAATTVIAPTKVFSQRLLTEETLELERVCQRITLNITLPDVKMKFHNRSVKDIYRILCRCSQLPKETIQKELYRSLPQNIKKKILSTSYPAVDTHWKESGEAILFSYTFNPFQGRYEWCLIGEKGSSLAVLDQDVWVKDRVWGLI